MRTLCDVCESAAAVLFCAADEAALCTSCDHQVHRCNKLVSRHVRVGLADPSQVPHCDICENAPAFFYCKIDGTSLCLQCDMIVHVGGKRTHGRYLLLRQRVQFPGDKQGHHVNDVSMHSKDQVDSRNDQKHVTKAIIEENVLDASGDDREKINAKMIDLNTRPYRNLGQASGSWIKGMSKDHLNGSNNNGWLGSD